MLERQHNQSSFSQLLAHALKGIATLSEEQLARLESHYKLLEHWNARMNLTSVRTMEEAVIRHYAESIFLATLLADTAPGSRVLDVGSGAGFPGIPLAVLRPDWGVTLVESHNRKAVFLREATRDLPNVKVVPKRVEDVTGHWQLLVSRAVRPQEVTRASLRLGQGIALLIGTADAENLPSAIQWRKPVPLPWGKRRVAVLGDVPRGTI